MQRDWVADFRARAKNSLEEARARLARQKKLVERLKANGRNAEQSEALLATMSEVVKTMELHQLSAQADPTKQSSDFAASALRRHETAFRLAMDVLPHMVWTARPDGSIDFRNRRFGDYLGWAANDLNECGWHSVLHPEDRDSTMDAWRKSVQDGTPFKVIHRIFHHSDGYRWTLSEASPILDGTGVITKWLGTETDIHQQKMAELAMQELNLCKDQFIATLSHELRNPLAPICAATDLLSIMRIENPQMTKAVDMIRRQVRHMTSLINGLLETTRVTRGLIKLDPHILDLRQVVIEAAEQVRPIAERREQRLQVELPKTPIQVRGDRVRLVQVVSNLLDNSSKYSPERQSISVTLTCVIGQAVVSVVDSGIGMTRDLQRTAFEVFRRGESSRCLAQGGLGLGLAVVKQLVELHGGSVQAYSAGEGQGSRFDVLLPLVDFEKQYRL